MQYDGRVGRGLIKDAIFKFICTLPEFAREHRVMMHLQKVELSELREEHRQQLEDISSQLLLFESSLRTKEKQLQETLCRKDQVFRLMYRRYCMKSECDNS